MTTLVYRAGVLIADTQASGGDSVNARVVKIAKRGRLLAAAAGQAAFARRGLDWFRSGCIGEPEIGCEKVNADLTIFMPDGTIVDLCPFGGTTQRAEYWANGSGADFALGAMAAGATADEAIRIAAGLDVWSSGPFIRLTH